MHSPWFVVGLGNPGPRYQRTRHNVGFQVTERFAELLQVRLRKAFLRSYRIARERTVESGLLIVQPLTFMNRSGEVLPRIIKRYDGSIEKCIVVTDNLDLPVGTVRFKRSGGASTHNGLKSVIDHVGTTAFPRLYVGIGRPKPGDSVVEHVLSEFGPEEAVEASAAIDKAAMSLMSVVTSGSLQAGITAANEAGDALSN